MSCIFCDIAAGRVPTEIVLRSEGTVAFLDHRPLFPGHVLLIPDRHYVTLADLPHTLLAPLFEAAQKLSVAIEQAMHGEGSFVAMNNKVSQSVPHLHIHIVPRRKGDGLKGFFWPRHRYESEAHLSETAQKIRNELKGSTYS